MQCDRETFNYNICVRYENGYEYTEIKSTKKSDKT